jgi:hypothetical protein
MALALQPQRSNSKPARGLRGSQPDWAECATEPVFVSKEVSKLRNGVFCPGAKSLVQEIINKNIKNDKLIFIIHFSSIEKAHISHNVPA